MAAGRWMGAVRTRAALLLSPFMLACGVRPHSDVLRHDAAPAELDGGGDSSGSDGDGSGSGIHDGPTGGTPGASDSSGTGGADAAPSVRVICPAGPEVMPDSDGIPGSAREVSAAAGGLPPTMPFSCASLPPVFLFPPSGPGAERGYGRCASFEVGEAADVAVSPDGRLAALVPADGVVRIVEIASRNVVAQVAPAHGSVRHAGFTPAGDAVLTVAAGEREATLWRVGAWTPLWTVSLPGQRYDFAFQAGGGLAFSPDGQTVAVSPGTGVFLLDVATGAVRASDLALHVVDLSYGWAGRRLAVGFATVTGHCAQGLNGGWVSILDAETLAPVAKVSERPGHPYFEGLPALQASPTGDLLLTSGTRSEPAFQAYRLSDGASLPPPAALRTLPLGFLADGKQVVTYDDGLLRIVGLDDGVVFASTPLPDGLAATSGWFAQAAPAAISADGRVVALGGQSVRLLRVWDSAANGEGQGAIAHVCAAESQDGSSFFGVPSLSPDGSLFALGWRSEVRIYRVADGARVATLSGDAGATVRKVDLSHGGRHALVHLQPAHPSPPPIVFRVADAVPLLTLAPQPGSEVSGSLFSPDGDRLYVVVRPQSGGDQRIEIFDLVGGGSPIVMPRSLPAGSSLIGFSAGCPVAAHAAKGAWRFCGDCDDTPTAAGGFSTLLSSDGRFLAAADPWNGARGVTVWRFPPDGAPAVRRLERRPEGGVHEYPLILSSGGDRVLLNGFPDQPNCYSGPRSEVHAFDIATGRLIDSLPPGPWVSDASARTLASYSQVWCAR